MKLIVHLPLAYPTWPREPAFITFALGVIRRGRSSQSAVASHTDFCVWIPTILFCLRFYFSTTSRKHNCPLREPIESGDRPPAVVTNEWKNTPDRDARSRAPHANRWPYRCAVDREHLSGMGRQAFCCEMSGGGAVASDLLGWLKNRRAAAKAGDRRSHDRLILPLRCVCHRGRWRPLLQELQRAASECHFKPINVAECEHRNVCVSICMCVCWLSALGNCCLFLSLWVLFSHHSNMGWQMNSVVMSCWDGGKSMVRR